VKIQIKAILYVLVISALSSAGVYMYLAARQMENAMRVTDEETGDAIVLSAPNADEKLEPIAKAPDFEYTDALGQKFNSTSLKGKIWIADFFFTSCPGICPVMMENMSKLAKNFEGKPVEFVCFSVDPETDTPERMRKFGDKYGANPSVWHLLTGPIEITAKLSYEGFKVGTVEAPMDHSSRMALVDQDGMIRGYFLGTDEADMENLSKATERLLEEMNQDDR